MNEIGETDLYRPAKPSNIPRLTIGFNREVPQRMPLQSLQSWQAHDQADSEVHFVNVKVHPIAQ